MASKMMVCTTNGAFGTSRQASMYNPTLIESQNSLIESGKNFDSMKREEVLQNMWTTEERQAIATAVLGNVHTESESERVSYQSNLQHGNRKLSGTLTDKTVDEVWKEIQLQKRQQEQRIQLQEQHHEPQGGQGGGGEMTLEDFLVKAGIVRDDPEVRPTNNPTVASFGTAFAADGSTPQAKVESIAQNQQNIDWYNYHVQEQQQQQQQQFLLQQQAGAAATIAGVAGPIGGILLGGNVLEAPLDIRPGLAPGNVASNQPLSPCLATPDTATKRRCFEVVERTVERRQRRMIKNRESAARSRARKQAYTTELEMEVMQLKEENLRLKRQRIAQTGAPTQELKKPVRVLRRTRSLSL